MKKNDFNSNQEFEKLLKEKMNELSTSVDCFDRISARAFPEKDSDFSDCGLTVSDLENVTGKRRIFPVLKWVSAAAAIVLCIGVIPKTALINSLRNSMENCPDKDSCSDIIRKINQETENGDYYICDLPLNDYISRNVLVTPMYTCPFEESGEDMNVRIFVRTIGGLRTNQIYAVEYHGVYSEDNIVAAAETGVTFSEKEAEKLADEFNYFFTEDESSKAVATAFTGVSSGWITDKDGNSVSAASFSDYSFYKKGKNIQSVRTDVIYYRYNDSDDYYYDIKVTSDAGSEVGFSENSWKRSVDCDGNPQHAEGNSGIMTKTDLFTGSYEMSGDICYFTPEFSYLPDKEQNSAAFTEHIIATHNSYNLTGTVLSAIVFPEDTAFQRDLRVYLGQATPVAEYSADAPDEISYHSSLDMTKADDSSVSEKNISAKISALSDELDSLDNASIAEDQKQLMELERLRIENECDKLKQYEAYLDEEKNRQMQQTIEDELQRQEMISDMEQYQEMDAEDTSIKSNTYRDFTE